MRGLVSDIVEEVIVVAIAPKKFKEFFTSKKNNDGRNAFF
jgi:hypothetical protein